MDEINEKELEVLISYFEKMGENVENFIKLKKISDGLYRGETDSDYYFGDTERIEIKFFNNNNCCTIERISTETLESENMSGNSMQSNITVEIKSDKFVKENDNVIWTTSCGTEIATSNNFIHSEYVTYDINKDNYIAFSAGGYPCNSVIDSKHITFSFQEVKTAKLKDKTLFTDISNCNFEQLTNSNSLIDEKSNKKTM